MNNASDKSDLYGKYGLPSRSSFVGPMRGEEPVPPEPTGDPQRDYVLRYLYIRDLRRYLAANGVSAPLTQVDADFVPPRLRDAETVAREDWESVSNPRAIGVPPTRTNSWER